MMEYSRRRTTFRMGAQLGVILISRYLPENLWILLIISMALGIVYLMYTPKAK